MKNIVNNTAKLLVIATVVLTGCKKKVEDKANEQELITTVELTFSNPDTTFVVQYEDLDGAGGNAPIIAPINLKANKNYNVNLKLLDKTKTPAENISDAVKAEGTDHQFFYVANNANLVVKTTDVDANNNPLGLTSTWATTNASTGTITITLKHQPKIKLASPGSIALGDTDVEAAFTVTIK